MNNKEKLYLAKLAATFQNAERLKPDSAEPKTYAALPTAKAAGLFYSEFEEGEESPGIVSVMKEDESVSHNPGGYARYAEPRFFARPFVDDNMTNMKSAIEDVFSRPKATKMSDAQIAKEVGKYLVNKNPSMYRKQKMSEEELSEAMTIFNYLNK